MLGVGKSVSQGSIDEIVKIDIEAYFAYLIDKVK